jgi:phosphocarrier protein
MAVSDAAERTVVVVNRLGLHARPAAEFVKTASKFEADIQLYKDSMEVNGKSILGVMTLAAECGSELVLRAQGADAEAAVRELADVLGRDFGNI